MNQAKTLEKFLNGVWEQFVIQGGELEWNQREQGYLLSALWIKIDSQWFQITSTDIHCDIGESDFCISVQKIYKSPIPEENKLMRPARKIIIRYPNDCRLDLFLGNIKCHISSRIFFKEDNSIVFCPSLLLKIDGGFTLEIRPSVQHPENILITVTCRTSHLPTTPTAT